MDAFSAAKGGGSLIHSPLKVLRQKLEKALLQSGFITEEMKENVARFGFVRALELADDGSHFDHDVSSKRVFDI